MSQSQHERMLATFEAAIALGQRQLASLRRRRQGADFRPNTDALDLTIADMEGSVAQLEEQRLRLLRSH